MSVDDRPGAATRPGDPGPGEVLLTMQGVTGGYGPVQVLHGLDLEVRVGEVAVILGANGAGKTTTLRAISGLLDKVSGTIDFKGQTLGRLAPHAVARAGIAHVPQGRGTFTDLTVDDNLRLGAVNRRDREVESDIESYYEMFPRLGERRTQAAGSMSGGEQQMLAICRALMARPELILLDEPSLGLAPLITRDVFERLADLNARTNLTMLIVEQNAMLALGIADRGYVLEAGAIVASGPADQLAADEGVRKAYLGF